MPPKRSKPHKARVQLAPVSSFGGANTVYEKCFIINDSKSQQRSTYLIHFDLDASIVSRLSLKRCTRIPFIYHVKYSTQSSSAKLKLNMLLSPSSNFFHKCCMLLFRNSHSLLEKNESTWENLWIFLYILRSLKVKDCVRKVEGEFCILRNLLRLLSRANHNSVNQQGWQNVEEKLIDFVDHCWFIHEERHVPNGVAEWIIKPFRNI